MAKLADKKKISFLGVQYQDVEKLKQIFRNIINSTSNNEEILKDNHEKLVELIKYHDKYPKKS